MLKKSKKSKYAISKGCTSVKTSRRRNTIKTNEVVFGKDYNDIGYAFVCNTTNNGWQYLYISDYLGDMYVSSTLQQYFTSITQEMIDFYKRFAIDRAFCVDSVDYSSLRLISFKVKYKDVTISNLLQDEDVEHLRKMAVIGGMSNEAIELFGLEKERAMYKISTNSEEEANDKNLVKKLNKHAEGNELSLDDLFRRE